jgi:chloramphenicol-sensitive protein RarD
VQYLSPTIQLALAVWVFHEPFDRALLVGFALIWAALLLYSADGWRRSRLALAPV